MQGSGQLKRDFKKAKDFFLKSLKVDAKDVTANYKLGVIYMLGLGVERDVTTALKYFEVS
jgi:TPR repeat protein